MLTVFLFSILDQDALKEIQENPAQNPLAEWPDVSSFLANLSGGASNNNNNERSNKKN